MKSHTKLITFFATIVPIIVIVSSLGYGQPAVGRQAPVFALNDVRGKRHDLATMEKHPMIILYFFDAASRSSQEGLLALDDLAGRYAEANLKVWGITISTKDKVENFIAQNNIIFPILLDDNAVVSDLYNARIILPTICILGPRLQILDYIQGGGKTTETMLVKLAEKELQRKQIAIAREISEYVVRRNPQNLEAKMVKGYAELKSGDLEAAEKTFNSLSQSTGQGKILGEEGMVSVYARQGQTKKALELAAQVENKAPDRGHVNTVKADILYTKGQKNEAQAEYHKALQKAGTSDVQLAATLHKLGRLQAGKGRYKQASQLYSQAIELNPFFIEAKVNLGMVYEKDGKKEKALKAYSEVLNLDRGATNVIESMRTGNIVFNTPQAMNMEETIIIKLILDLKWSIEVLSQKLEAKGEIDSDTIKVTDRMEAKLSGPDFQITAITPELQFITPKNMTEWKWEIKPKTPGLHKLYLALNAYFEVYGNSTPTSIRTFEKEISIEVTWGQRATIFFKNNWQWFWTSIFIPIFFYLWRNRKKLHIFINQKKISKH